MNKTIKYDECVYKTTCEIDKTLEKEFRNEFREEFRNLFNSLLNNLEKICSHEKEVNELLYEEDILILHEEDVSKLFKDFKFQLDLIQQVH